MTASRGAQEPNPRRRFWSGNGAEPEAADEAGGEDLGGEPEGGGAEDDAAASLDQVLRHAMAARGAGGDPGDGGAPGPED